MADLYITEYKHPDMDDANDGIILAKEPKVAHQVVSYTTSTQSSAFDAETSCIRIVAPQACYIEFGTNPTATTSTQYLPANVVEYKFVPKGQSFKVAAYDGTS